MNTYTLRYRSVDGYTVKKSFKTRTGARGFIVHWVGENADEGAPYFVSPDGVGVVYLLASPQGETLSTILEG